MFGPIELPEQSGVPGPESTNKQTNKRIERRLHKRPNAYEIERCRWWFETERAIVRPTAMGATAVGVLGRSIGIFKAKGQPLALADGTAVFVTIHPSYLLRIQDEADKAREYRSFVSDLKLASKILAARPAGAGRVARVKRAS
jgi:DNA polymerase